MKGEYRTRLTGIADTPLTVAAHELKTPLVLLRQLAYSLEDETLSDDARNEIVAHMKLVSEQALRLTTDITKVARLEDSIFDCQPLNPLAICNDVIRDSAPLYKAHGHALELRASRPAVLVTAHRDLLHRVLINLTNNALQHTDTHRPVCMSIGRAKATGDVRISVRDYGPVLPTEVWRSINQQQSVAHIMSSRPGSSGLGLAISAAFMQAMGGRIGAVRHRDGASLYVDVPQSRQLCLL